MDLNTCIENIGMQRFERVDDLREAGLFKSLYDAQQPSESPNPLSFLQSSHPQWAVLNFGCFCFPLHPQEQCDF
jgi:hypothetical protein